MVGFLAAVAGGALEGYGKGRLLEIQAMRAESLRQLENEREDRILARKEKFERDMHTSDQTFQSTEAEKGRTFQIGQTDRQIAADDQRSERERGWRTTEREETQGFTSGESDKDRKSREAEAAANRDAAADRDVVAGPDGTSGIVKSGVFKAVVDEKGVPIKVPPKVTGATSGDVQTMQYLMDHGVPFERARKDVLSKGKSEEDIETSLYKTVMESSKPMAGETTEETKARSDAAWEIVKARPRTSEEEESADATGPGAVRTVKDLASEKPAIIAEAKARAANATADQKAAMRSKLREMGIDPAEAGL